MEAFLLAYGAARGVAAPYTEKAEQLLAQINGSA